MKVRVMVGSGGVGKTSVSAATALRFAQEGAKCLVLTIDPAARLKTALGVGVGSEETRVDNVKGELYAACIDVTGAFEKMVRRMARPDRLDTLLASPVYRALRSLAGMQELMAVEHVGRALHGGFDAIVVDTAPSRHALDFLDKPEYLSRLVSFPLVKLVGKTWKLWQSSPFGALSKAGLDLFRQIENLVGAQLARDVLEFFSAFQTVAQTYAKEAEETLAVLRDPAVTSFTVVSTPLKAAGDAAWFHEELKARHFRIGELIVNRVWPNFDLESNELGDWYNGICSAQRRALEALQTVPNVVELPELSADIDGLPALERVARSLY